MPRAASSALISPNVCSGGRGGSALRQMGRVARVCTRESPALNNLLSVAVTQEGLDRLVMSQMLGKPAVNSFFCLYSI